MRVAVLDMYNNRPGQGIRGIRSLLDGNPLVSHYEIFNVRGANQVPDNSFDAYISSGGPGNPLEQHYPWYQEWVALMDDLLNNHRGKKHVFLICHSFQVMCHHLGVAEVRLRKSPAFGIFPVHKSEFGPSESLFKELADPFYAVDSRNWQVVQPDPDKLKSINAQVLCIEKERPHVDLERACMGIRFSESFVGFQFHPEADAHGMMVYFRSPQKKREVIRDHGGEKYNEMLRLLDDEDKIMHTYRCIIPAFLQASAKSMATR
ncbi:MAG: type 1 glutamine amidotransferase [Bacteroidota bacterium]